MQTEEDELQKAIDEITNKSGGAVESIADSLPPVPPTPDMPGMPEGMPDPVDSGAPGVFQSGRSMATSDPMNSNQSQPEAQPQSQPEVESGSQPESMSPAQEPAGDLSQVKEQALRDLFPLMDKINIMPEQKYRIYEDMFELMGDSSALKSALEAAKQISDDAKRGEALLSIVEMIDNK